MILVLLVLAAALVFAAFALLGESEVRVIEPCRHCTPGVHWHYGDHCPTLSPPDPQPGEASA